MNVLVFDSSTDIMHVTLGKDAVAIDSRVVKTTETQYNSAFLVSTISGLLKHNNLSMSDIQAIGLNIGPGSFTGMRASATIARVIAQQLDIPAVGVPSMQIYSALNNTDKSALCLIDARRGMAYVGIYNKNFEPELEPCLIEYEKAIEMAETNNYLVITDSRMAKKLSNFTNYEESDFDFGKTLLELTVKKLKEKNKEEYNWSKLKPLYIQTPPIHGLKD